jgi:hypothetical protein
VLVGATVSDAHSPSITPSRSGRTEMSGFWSTTGIPQQLAIQGRARDVILDVQQDEVKLRHR